MARTVTGETTGARVLTDARELRGELAGPGVVVRDEKRKQYRRVLR